MGLEGHKIKYFLAKKSHSPDFFILLWGNISIKSVTENIPLVLCQVTRIISENFERMYTKTGPRWISFFLWRRSQYTHLLQIAVAYELLSLYF